MQGIAGVLGLFLLLVAGAGDEQVWDLLWKAAWPPPLWLVCFLCFVVAGVLALRKSGRASIVLAATSAAALCVAVAIAGDGPGYGSTANGAPLPHEYVGVGYGYGSAVALVYLLALVVFLALRRAPLGR